MFEAAASSDNRPALSNECFQLNFHLCPVVSSAALPKDKVVRPEELAIGAAPHRVHRSRLKVNKNGLIGENKVLGIRIRSTWMTSIDPFSATWSMDIKK